MFTSLLFPSIFLSGIVLSPSHASPEELSAQIDTILKASWNAAHLTPEGLADDSTFARRAWLDLAGTIPPHLIARDFLRDQNPNRRSKLVNELLDSPEFADYWARIWTHNLTGQRANKFDRYDGRVLQEYLKTSLAKNKPYNEIVNDLLCGEGVSDSSGPANFLLRFEGKPTDLAGAVGKRLLGISLQCAQCHDHPFDHWKKDDFWGLAAYFGRVRVFESDSLFAVHEVRKGDLQVPDPAGKPDEEGKPAMKTVAPHLPGKEPMPVQGSRRATLAEWVTAQDNPFFVRNVVNQVWTQLFGRGLVRSLDKDGQKVDPAFQQILEILAADFTAHGHDFKRLVRSIVLTEAYQRAARGSEEASGEAAIQAADLRHKKLGAYACFATRPLSVDQVYLSIVAATGHTGKSAEEEAKEQAKQEEDAEEESADTAVALLGERALTVQRSLALLNGDFVQQAVMEGAKLALKLNGRKLRAGHIDWLFLATVSRRPTEEENTAMLKLAKASPTTATGLEDVLWVLLNSAEFNTNH